MKVLVRGGASSSVYHIVKSLNQNEIDAATLDDLSTKNRTANLVGDFVGGRLLNSVSLDPEFIAKTFDVIIQLANSIFIGELLNSLSRYYRSNLIEPNKSAYRCRVSIP